MPKHADPSAPARHSPPPVSAQRGEEQPPAQPPRSQTPPPGGAAAAAPGRPAPVLDRDGAESPPLPKRRSSGGEGDGTPSPPARPGVRGREGKEASPRPAPIDTSGDGLRPAAAAGAGERRGSDTHPESDGPWRLEVEDVDGDALSPLASPAEGSTSMSPGRRVRGFRTEVELEGHVSRALRAAEMGPGSPSHKVHAAFSPCPTPLARIHKRRLSTQREPTGELCELFPDTPAAASAQEWVPRLNRLLKGEACATVLPYKEFHDVMVASAEVISKDPGCPVIDITAQEAPLSVVGDLHGMLQNLLRNVLGPVLRKEVAWCRWLFLGDLIDRGAEGCEVLAIVALMKLCWPQHVTILRGNHEDAPISYVYGFFQECEQKYGGTQGEDSTAWHSANVLFVELPIAAVVRDPERGDEAPRKFFCCHGGLTPKLQLSAEDPVALINSMQRVKYGQLRLGQVDAALGPSSPIAQPETCLSLIEGLLWSDPDDCDEPFKPSARGAGDLWGREASEAFCNAGGFDFICRAHQMVEPGYLRQHRGLVLTVFSAADYCGMGNKGAVLRVTKDGDGWRHSVAQFEAPPEGDEASPAAAATGTAGVTPLLPYFRGQSPPQDDE